MMERNADSLAALLHDKAVFVHLSKIRLVAVVGGNEVTNAVMVPEVYLQDGGARKLAALSFTRLLTAP
jgi:hypothetical protein